MNDTEKEKFLSVLAKRTAESLAKVIIAAAGEKAQVESKRSRKSKERPDYSTSTMGAMLKNEHNLMLNTCFSEAANAFRRRFRVPYSLFYKVLVPMCASKEVFSNTEGKFAIPVNLKVLIALRILGRDATADDCVMNSGVSERTCNQIFHEFVTNFSKHFYDEYVFFPDLQRDRNQFITVLETFRLLGMPGAIANIDATHVQLDKNPAEHKFRCNNRKGQQSIAFQAACGHDRRIFHVSKAFVGSQCDSNTLKSDHDMLHALFQKYKDIEFVIYDMDGTPHIVRGLYFISDNGYPKWSGLISSYVAGDSFSRAFFYRHLVTNKIMIDYYASVT
jgi:hypothetical protein